MIQANLIFCVEHLYEEQAYCGMEHSHPCYELVFYRQGEGVVEFNKKKYAFEKDTFIVCPPEVKHIEKGSKDTDVLYIGFELAGGMELPEGIFKEKNYGVLEYLEKIYYEIKHWKPHSYELVNHFVAIIVLKLINSYEYEKERIMNHDFDNIVGYISANFKDNINTKDLAGLAGYSYDYFRKMFVKKFNMTVNDFILQKRIDAATDMIRSKGYLIKEIASDCGFSSVAQFCTKYKEYTGITPKQMQKKILEDEKNIEKDKYSD